MILFIFNRNKFLELLEVTDLQFLKSKYCHNNIKILYKHRDRALKLTSYFFMFIIFNTLAWPLFSLMINHFKENENERLENVINWRFPVNVNTYNQYFKLFWALETTIGIQMVYFVFIIDVLILSVGWAITIQYEVLAEAFKNMRHHVNVQKGETTFFTIITIYCHNKKLQNN